MVKGNKYSAHTDLPDAALVRRDLAKVCTVPVLLVNTTLYAVNAGVDKVVIS